jgi:hypothetical protein
MLPSSPAKDRYAELGRNPASWFMSGQTMMRAAHLILEHHLAAFSPGPDRVEPEPGGGGIIKDDWRLVDMELHRVYYLLSGLAIECMFKGLIVQQNPSAIVRGKKFPWQQYGHDLCRLAATATLSTTAEEAELLAHQSGMATWKSKYPVGSKDKSHSIYDFPLHFLALGGTHNTEVRILIDSIYESARKAYHLRERAKGI